jgi:hypothetical protein
VTLFTDARVILPGIRGQNHPVVADNELDHLLTRSGFTHPEVFTLVFDASLRGLVQFF